MSAGKHNKMGWRHKLPMVAKRAAIGSLVVIAALTLLAIIFWDADHFAARQRFESFKFAWFGKWIEEVDLRPTAEDEKFEQSIADALDGASEITFFRSAQITGSNLTVMTGSSFLSTQDVVTGALKNQWCYLSYRVGEISRRIELATKEGTAPPVYADLSKLSADDFLELGLSRSRLNTLSYSHCKLGQFDLNSQ